MNSKIARIKSFSEPIVAVNARRLFVAVKVHNGGEWAPELLQLLELLNSFYLFSLSCRSSCRQASGIVVMFFLITYQTAEATISDINLARQFSTKKRLTVLFMAITQTVSGGASPLA